MNLYNNFLCLFVLLLFSSVVFSSSRKYKDAAPGFLKLKEDPLFRGVFEFGKIKYEDLYQCIQNNITRENEEELIFEQEDLVYTFNKQSKIIESLGCGYKILLYPNGIIKLF
jgi:hypothetical protein